MTVSSQLDLAGLKKIGRVVALALQRMREATRDGVTTAELDAVAADVLREHGARSAPQLTYGFPGVTCISVNEQVVHGIPGPRILRPGDVVKLDVSAELDGYIADAAITVTIPPASAEARRLRRCAEAAFERALSTARAGVRVSAVGREVEREVRRHGCSVLRELCGHGVGRRLHEEPSVPNYFNPDTPGTLSRGLVVALEPLVSARPTSVVDEPDGWTVRTRDRCIAAHFEHTVVITDGAPIVLTAA